MTTPREDAGTRRSGSRQGGLGERRSWVLVFVGGPLPRRPVLARAGRLPARVHDRNAGSPPGQSGVEGVALASRVLGARVVLPRPRLRGPNDARPSLAIGPEPANPSPVGHRRAEGRTAP